MRNVNVKFENRVKKPNQDQNTATSILKELWDYFWGPGSMP